MIIENNKVVYLSYELSIDNPDDEMVMVEKVNEDNPFVFLFGSSGLPEGFENQLLSLSEGDAFDFTVNPEEGYGDIDENAIVELPIDIFKVDGEVDNEMLQPGSFVPMTDGEGHRLQGKVLKVDDTTVTMDFNHPLAGMNMHFVGKVLKVREASAEEIAHGHVHGEGGAHH
jgi:FKBP-type peptidyl-prolyl cis-trans isomerase SlyD